MFWKYYTCELSINHPVINDPATGLSNFLCKTDQCLNQTQSIENVLTDSEMSMLSTCFCLSTT